jgi:hypothetical protein
MLIPVNLAAAAMSPRLPDVPASRCAQNRGRSARERDVFDELEFEPRVDARAQGLL